MEILLLSRYENLGASSRYRSYQYLPYLYKQGINITVAPLFDDNYIKDLYTGKNKNLFKILKAYAKRIVNLHYANNFDLIWLEKETLPLLPAWIEFNLGLKRTSYIVDYDDAIFHQYDKNKFELIKWILGHKIDLIMKRANTVLVGNEYLLGRAKKAGARRIELLPTVIDLRKYPGTFFSDNDIFTIGWIGSPITSHYLKLVIPALEEICKNNTARLVLIGAKREDLPTNIPVKYVSWSEETETKEIQKFDVGIMPLPDNALERGKCGLKLIQYMACGKPIIGSPVGINKKIIKHGINGYQARNIDEWIWAINKLENDPKLRQKMGKAGRKIVEKEYCLQVTAPCLVEILYSVIKSNYKYIRFK